VIAIEQSSYLAKWMTKTVVDAEVLDIETVSEALKTSPYGVCVYEAGNDVVDHQTVTLEYEGGVTASVVMSACESHATLHCFSMMAEDTQSPRQNAKEQRESPEQRAS
jgi:hypothetical protein